MRLELAVDAPQWGDARRLKNLARQAVVACLEETGQELGAETELSVLLTDDAAVREMNRKWRGVDRPTNVLSFPLAPAGEGDLDQPMLGDIVLAFETVSREADLEGKSVEHHFSHLILHGFLHILGYDHEEDHEAEIMEQLERRILARLHIADPYA